MTVIVYKHDQNLISLDSRLSTGDFITSDNYDKSYIANNGDILFISGRIDHANAILDEWPNPINKKIRTQLMYVRDNCVYGQTIDERACGPYRLTYDLAIGSGSELAIAALDHGASTHDAVKYAISRDSCCGGTIRTFDVSAMKWI